MSDITLRIVEEDAGEFGKVKVVKARLNDTPSYIEEIFTRFEFLPVVPYMGQSYRHGESDKKIACAVKKEYIETIEIYNREMKSHNLPNFDVLIEFQKGMNPWSENFFIWPAVEK